MIRHYNSKTGKLITTVVVLFLASPCFSQQVSGNWCSSDRTRVYTVRNTNSGLEAVLSSSTRKEDLPGVLIIRARKKKRGTYSGTITNPARQLTTAVKLRINKKNELLLKLRRMFIFTVRIKWYRSPGNG